MKNLSRMNPQIPGNLYLQIWKLAWTIMLAGNVAFISTGASKADTIHVNSCATGPGDGSQSHPYYSLKTAVKSAAAGDVIILKPGIYYEKLAIDKKLTIKASGGRANVGNGLVRRLRVMTHNVYGKSKEKCDLRASRLGENIARADPAYDIVGMQEYYSNLDADLFSCDSDHLSNAIWSTGRYRNSNNYYRFYPTGEVWDNEADGGIGIFTLHPIIKFKEFEWSSDLDFLKSLKPHPAHGFIFARTRIPCTPLTIDIYVVHLHAGVDGCDQNCRWNELNQLTKCISEHSRNSANPVLVMGDFNIGGPPTNRGNRGYEDIVYLLHNPRDLWLESHPDEAGFTFDSEENTVVEDDNAQYRIDYIFVLEDPFFTNSNYKIEITQPNDVKLVQWRVIKPPYGHYVSDHFGVEATIEIRDR